MIGSVIAEFGPWNWMVLGFVLLVLEIVIPGVFMLWIGIAALLVGTLSLQLWNAGFWTWQLQVVVFLVLSLASAYVGTRIMRSRKDGSDQPLLNKHNISALVVTEGGMPVGVVHFHDLLRIGAA